MDDDIIDVIQSPVEPSPSLDELISSEDWDAVRR